MNIVGSIFAIVGIVLYAVHLGTVNMSWRCHGPDANYSCYYLAAVAQVSTLSQNGFIACFFKLNNTNEKIPLSVQKLLTAADVTLIIMAVLQLCVSITVAAVSITSLKQTEVWARFLISACSIINRTS